MKLSEIKNQLATLDAVTFLLPNGTMVPQHFHVTEVGQITKDFIDCGGKIRHENVYARWMLFIALLRLSHSSFLRRLLWCSCVLANEQETQDGQKTSRSKFMSCYCFLNGCHNNIKLRVLGPLLISI